MKRARSVAIFSLKLKERRAREAQEKAANKPVTPTAPLPPPQCGGGELSCIPIEKVSQKVLNCFCYHVLLLNSNYAAKYLNAHLTIQIFMLRLDSNFVFNM